MLKSLKQCVYIIWEMEITKNAAQYCTIFCYFHTNSTKIVKNGMKITPPYQFRWCLDLLLKSDFLDFYA
jgi:hypothetical protein